MTATIQPLTQRKAWKALAGHFMKVKDLHLRDLFAAEPKRGEEMSLIAAGLYLDYSKNRVTNETLKLLVELARESGLKERLESMFNGDKINVTEKRAVLHVALRAPKEAAILFEGENVVPKVHEVLDRMTEFSNRVRNGTWKGHTENSVMRSSTSCTLGTTFSPSNR